MWLNLHTDIMWWCEIHEANVFLRAPPPRKSTVSYMRKASVAMTPQVWKAWWNSASSGYFTAASMMIHHPVKNCTNHKHEHARQMWTELKQEALHHRHKTKSRRYFWSYFLSVRKTQMPEQYQDSSSHRCDGVPPLPPVHAALTVSTSDPVQKSWHDCGKKCVWTKQQAVFQIGLRCEFDEAVILDLVFTCTESRAVTLIFQLFGFYITPCQN